MAPSFYLSVLVFTRLFSHASGVAVVMRSEEKGQAFVEADGSVGIRESESNGDMCDVDYPLGNESTCDCVDTTHHSIILDEEMCKEAAKEAGLHAAEGKFMIHSAWFDKHPKGCFKDKCTSDASDQSQCYFYNPATSRQTKCVTGVHRDSVTGVPVCKRDRFVKGTPDTNGGCLVGGTVHADYGVIMDEDHCVETAICMGDALGEEFRVDVLDASLHDTHPLGCYIDTKEGGDGKVRYNPPHENVVAPRFPKGTPLCNVTVRTWISGGGATGSSTVGVEARTTNTSQLFSAETRAKMLSTTFSAETRAKMLSTTPNPL